jgi:hypothetical protein
MGYRVTIHHIKTIGTLVQTSLRTLLNEVTTITVVIVRINSVVRRVVPQGSTNSFTVSDLKTKIVTHR